MLLLVVFFAIAIIILYFLHNRDIMCPSVVVCIVYLISILFATYNWDRWELCRYSYESIGIIISGVTIFAFVGLLLENVLSKKRKTRSGNMQYKLKSINFNKFLIIIILIFSAFTLVWMIMDVLRVTGHASLTHETMRDYRAMASYGILDVENMRPFLLSQFLKITLVQGYFFVFVIINNLLVREVRLSDCVYAAPVLVTVCQTLLNAGRLEIMKLLCYAFIIYYILLNYKYGWKKNFSQLMVKKGIKYFAVLLCAFWLSASLVGRDTSRYDNDPMYYMSLYGGGSIKLFDMYITDPTSPSDILGKETFYSINRFLGQKLGYEELLYIPHLEFRDVNGWNVGNVYTALRRYHYDFGYSGMCVLVAIMSGFFNYLYFSIKRQQDLSFKIMLLGYTYSSLPMFSIDDIFFGTFISVAGFINIVLLYIAFQVFIKKRLVIKFKIKTKGIPPDYAKGA